MIIGNYDGLNSYYKGLSNENCAHLTLTLCHAKVIKGQNTQKGPFPRYKLLFEE